jgi:hypothetical protein
MAYARERLKRITSLPESNATRAALPTMSQSRIQRQRAWRRAQTARGLRSRASEPWRFGAAGSSIPLSPRRFARAGVASRSQRGGPGKAHPLFRRPRIIFIRLQAWQAARPCPQTACHARLGAQFPRRGRHPPPPAI